MSPASFAHDTLPPPPTTRNPFIDIDPTAEPNLLLLPLPSPSFERTHSSSSSISSVSSSRIVDPRGPLPTPPPERHDEEEPTPRPANLEPSLSQFEKGMQLKVPDDDDEPRPGSIITSHTPHLLRERGTQIPTGTSSRR
ncbi:hypothetical protein K443DRAFT_681808, partial [Laccaria amethystina LaAM-08-1]